MLAPFDEHLGAALLDRVTCGAYAIEAGYPNRGTPRPQPDEG